jgi:hypothetical protein
VSDIAHSEADFRDLQVTGPSGVSRKGKVATAVQNT